MTEYAVTLTEAARQDTTEISLYIANALQNLDAANRFLDHMEKAIDSLEQMPNRQPLVHDEMLAAQGFHFLSVDNYSLFYKVYDSEKTVLVIRVLYSKQDWLKILQ